MTSKLENCDKAANNRNKNMIEPPDGGVFAWMIVGAFGIANALIIPVITSFGLIFKDKFQSMNMSAIDSTLILNLNSALGMTLGLVNGVLLKQFGYRKVAFMGGTLFSSGLIMTAWANSFRHFLITYSIVTSIGMGLCSSAFSLALNSYFKNNRNKAVGIAMSITGIGPIILPQLITFLLNVYSTQGCVLIIGGVAMNIMAAALLLQPVKWHQRKIAIDSRASNPNTSYQIVNTEVDDRDSIYKATPSINCRTSQNQPTNSWEVISEDENEYLETCPIFHDIDTQSIYGFDITTQPLRKSDETLWSDLNYKFIPKTVEIKHAQSVQVLRQRTRSGSVDMVDMEDPTKFFSLPSPTKQKRWFEPGSIISINLGSSMGLFHEDERPSSRLTGASMRMGEVFPGRRTSIMKMNLSQRRNTVGTIEEHEIPKEIPTVRKESPLPTIPIIKPDKPQRFTALRNGWKRFVKVFDLGLLNDAVYLNMMIGISIAVFAEINFSLLTPFILNEFNYTTKEIAVFMSVLATVDICCRFISPFIGDYFKQPPRIMYMYALLMLIITRSCLLFVDTYQGILTVAVGLGVAKGVRSVYMSLVVPSYIPLERLAAASGIQMVANGILILLMGSFVGIFRDLFGSYSICIIFINFVTLCTLILWTLEMVYMKRKTAEKAKHLQGQEILELCKFNISVN